MIQTKSLESNFDFWPRKFLTAKSILTCPDLFHSNKILRSSQLILLDMTKSEQKKLFNFPPYETFQKRGDSDDKGIKNSKKKWKHIN